MEEEWVEASSQWGPDNILWKRRKAEIHIQVLFKELDVMDLGGKEKGFRKSLMHFKLKKTFMFTATEKGTFRLCQKRAFKVFLNLVIENFMHL